MNLVFNPLVVNREVVLDAVLRCATTGRGHVVVSRGPVPVHKRLMPGLGQNVGEEREFLAVVVIRVRGGCCHEAVTQDCFAAGV